MLCLLLHSTISDIDECEEPKSCSFSYLQYRHGYCCVNVLGKYYCFSISVSVSDCKSHKKIIIIGMSFYPLRSTLIEKDLPKIGR